MGGMGLRQASLHGLDHIRISNRHRQYTAGEDAETRVSAGPYVQGVARGKSIDNVSYGLRTNNAQMFDEGSSAFCSPRVSRRCGNEDG